MVWCSGVWAGSCSFSEEGRPEREALTLNPRNDWTLEDQETEFSGVKPNGKPEIRGSEIVGVK
jgi:hypothetical protein